MGKANKIQINSDWDLEETVRQVEQKFATDLKTIARGNDQRREITRNTGMHNAKKMEQSPEEYKEYH